MKTFPVFAIIHRHNKVCRVQPVAYEVYQRVNNKFSEKDHSSEIMITYCPVIHFFARLKLISCIIFRFKWVNTWTKRNVLIFCFGALVTIYQQVLFQSKLCGISLMRGPTESVNIKAKSLYKCNLRLSLLIYYMQKLPELHDEPYTRKNRNKKKNTPAKFTDKSLWRTNR